MCKAIRLTESPKGARGLRVGSIEVVEPIKYFGLMVR